MAKYNLLDTGYFNILSNVTEGLERKNIPYVVGGGTAVQSKIISLLTDDGEQDMKSCSGLSGSLDVLLRETGDIDLATIAEDVDMITYFNELNAMSTDVDFVPRSEHMVEANSHGSRIFVNYMTSPDEFKGAPGLYEDIIRNAEEVNLRRGSLTSSVYIPKPEHILVTKLMRRAEKDKIDLANLTRALKVSGEEVDFEEVRKTLQAIGMEEKFDYVKENMYDLFN